LDSEGDSARTMEKKAHCRPSQVAALS